jgi:iron complex transport system substrate-binding protein
LSQPGKGNIRIASLVPSSTEMLFALGLGDQVVAVTHECDWPPAAAALPHLTRTVIPAGLSAAEIDQTVRDTVGAGRPLYELDRERLAELAPDLIVTQAVCDVCAVSYEDVVAVARTLPSHPRVLSLDPLTLEEVLADIGRLGEAADARPEARLLREQARRRIDAVTRAVAEAPRPRVAAIEWLDPPFVAGHWVPEMIALAGGEDALGHPGERSRTAEWDEIADAAPEVAIVMPCGYDAARSAEEAAAFGGPLSKLGARRIVAVDASAYFSRPGPRLVTGIELLGHILHPSRVPDPAAGYLAVA